MVYSIVFLLLMTFSLLELSTKFTRTQRVIISILPFTILVLLSGLRWKTGNDWNAYYDFYLYAESMFYHASSYEYGFRGVVQLSKYFGFEYTSFLLSISFLQLVGFYVLFIKLKNPSLMLFILFCTYCLGYMGTMRQTIAISFFLMGIGFSISKINNESGCSVKLVDVVCFICLVVATLFHFSAIVCFIVFIIPIKKFHGRVYVLILMACVLISSAVVPIALNLIEVLDGEGLVSKIIDYATVKSSLGEQKKLLILWYLKRLVLAFCFYLLISYIKSRVYYFLYNLYFFSLLIFVLFIDLVPLLAIRGGEYFSIFEVVFLGALLSEINRREIRIVVFVFGSVLLAGRMYNTLHSYHPDLFLPYYSVLDKGGVAREMY